MIAPILAPRENANDDVIKIVAVLKMPGTAVKVGDTIFEVEGAKAVTEIEASVGGYFFPVKERGDEVEVGAVIGVITDKEEFDAAEVRAMGNDTTDKYLHLTPLNLDNAQVPSYPQGQAKGGRAARLRRDSKHRQCDFGRLVAIGAGRGLAQLIEVLAGRPKWRLIGCYDDLHWVEGLPRLGLPLLGPVDVELLAEDFSQKTFNAAIITVSTSIDFRSRIFEKLVELGIELPALVHPSAVIHETARIGRGTLIMPYVHVGPFAEIGDNNFISSYCNIEHHCVLGDHNTFGPSVVLSGGVTMGSRIKLGTGIFIEPLVTIDSGCNIASGCTIAKNIGAGTIVKAKSNVRSEPGN